MRGPAGAGQGPWTGRGLAGRLLASSRSAHRLRRSAALSGALQGSLRVARQTGCCVWARRSAGQRPATGPPRGAPHVLVQCKGQAQLPHGHVPGTPEASRPKPGDSGPSPLTHPPGSTPQAQLLLPTDRSQALTGGRRGHGRARKGTARSRGGRVPREDRGQLRAQDAAGEH